MLFKVGDSVKVKEGTMCPDDNSVRIAGWQGRVFEIEEDSKMVGIRWDSITLEQLPREYIKKSEKEGLGWTEMYLAVDEIGPTSPRDSEITADEVAEKMESKFHWLGIDKEGERIFKVIADSEDEIEAWYCSLRGVLQFPFEAKVNEYQEKGPLKEGDKVQVQRITEADDLYGILVKVKYDRQHFVFPLSDLAVLDKKAANYTPLNDYCVWFANR